MRVGILILSAVLALWGIVIFNLLVRDRNRVAAAWSDVGVQLKRRYDLIPKLVEAVKQYARYERGVLERVVAGRTQALTATTPAQKGGAEATLGHDLRRLIAVAEAYPEIKANQGFLDLLRNLSESEDHIQHARRYYNGTVNNLNTRVDSVPDMIVARGFGFRPAEYFELDRPEEAQSPEDRRCGS